MIQTSQSAQINGVSLDVGADAVQEQFWNWHAQNADIVQYHPGFSSRYSGANSLSSANEVKETVLLDLLFRVRLWRGAEFHVDGLMWPGSASLIRGAWMAFLMAKHFDSAPRFLTSTSLAFSYGKPSGSEASRRFWRMSNSNWQASATIALKKP